MGKFDGVLLTSDFDNTLVDSEIARRDGGAMPEVSEKNKAALRYFMDNGGRFAVATGRALAAFLNFAPQVPMNAPGVVCNGAALYDFAEGEYLETVLMNENVREHGQATLDRFPTLAVEAYHIDNVIHAVRPNVYTEKHMHMTHVAVEECASLFDVPLPLGKLLFEDCHEVLEQVRQWLLEQPWSAYYEILFSAETLLEVTAKGASKGEMVLRLAKRLGIAREHIYCIGDENNDLSMLNVAAQGFAPANCSENVRTSGATIVSHCGNHALADVVEILGEKYA